MTSLEEAALLIATIHNELNAGTIHYNKAGEVLVSVDEILACMTEEGGVTFEPSTERAEALRKNLKGERRDTF